MKWSEVIERVAVDSGVSVAQARRVLTSFTSVCLSSLAANEEVSIARLGVIGTRLRKGRTIRSIANHRKMHVGERYLVQFRPAAAARRAAAALLPQTWREPEHQAAWRLAETLVSDLNLYHPDRAPQLVDDLDDDAVIAECKASFAALWRDVERAYTAGTSDSVRDTHNYLAGACRRAWSL